MHIQFNLNGDTVITFGKDVADQGPLGHVLQMIADWTTDRKVQEMVYMLVRKYQQQATDNLIPFPTHIPCDKCGKAIALRTDKYTVEEGRYTHTVCPWGGE